jgi:hypothetical protein
MGFWEKSLRVFKCLCENGRQGVRRIAQQTGLSKKQHLDNLRRKDSLRGAETAEISVRLGNYSASHFEGSALRGEVGLDHGVGHPLLLLYDVKAPNGQKSNEFNDLNHYPSSTS